MDPVVAPAAPAQPPAAPTTVSASIDAANRGDFDAFDKAELGKRTGAPVADVPVVASDDDAAGPAPPAPGAQDGRTVSARQQKTNDAIRDAVARATKDSADRIAALERQLAAPPAPKPAAAVETPPAAKTPEYKRIMALTGAPKLADFESVEEHAFAAAAFIDDVRTKERDGQARTRAQHESRFAAEKAVDDAFFEQLDKAKTADPEFIKKVAPDVLALTPVEWLPRDTHGRAVDAAGRPIAPGPQHVIASQLRTSPMVRELMLHFSQQPDELARLVAGPPQLAAVPVDQRTPAQITQHVRWIDHEMKRLEGRLAGHAPTSDTTAVTAATVPAPRSPITAAPPPPPTLRAAGSTSDPTAAALARGDFDEYDRLQVQERLAKLAPR